MFRDQMFYIGTVDLHFVEGPASGPPLVLLHGGSARWQTWEPLLGDLATNWHVYAVDLRGHDQSSWAASYRLQDYATDVADLLNDCITEPAVLFGHSLGGMVALMVAAQHSKSVRALIVGNAPLRWEHWREVLQGSVDRLIEWRKLAAACLSVEELVTALQESPMEVAGQLAPLPAREVFGADAPWFHWMASNPHGLDPETLTLLIDDVAMAATGYEMEQLLPAIACPVLLLQADPSRGALMTDGEVAHARTLLAQLTHVQLAGVGHPLHTTHPAAVLDTIRAFLMTVSNSGTVGEQES